MLVWQDWYEDVMNPVDGMLVRAKQVDSHTAKFDLTFELMPTELGLEGSIEYNTTLFCSDTIENLSYEFVNILEQCINFPELSLSNLSFNVLLNQCRKYRKNY